MTDYNGWPSRSSWLVFTWITNDPGVRDAAAEAASLSPRALEEFFRDWALSSASPDPEEAAPLLYDLVNRALLEVDWERVASGVLAQAGLR